MQPDIAWPNGWTPDPAPEEPQHAPVMPPPVVQSERANIQLMIAFTRDSQTLEIQGEDAALHPGGCGCPDCKEDRFDAQEVRQEQKQERCEAEIIDPARARRIRIYRWRYKHDFPLFYRCRAERELLRQKRAARMQLKQAG